VAVVIKHRKRRIKLSSHVQSPFIRNGAFFHLTTSRGMVQLFFALTRLFYRVIMIKKRAEDVR
jgi:hypothetical protein